MLFIKFSRVGKRKQPLYRLIVTEKGRDPWGDYLENLGSYNPQTKRVTVKVERVNHWLAKGAQTSPTIHNLLVSQGLIKADKVRASKSRPGKKKQAELAAQKAQEKAEANTKVQAAAEAPVSEATAPLETSSAENHNAQNTVNAE
jgi:small subunit ribosomal protein S16